MKWRRFLPSLRLRLVGEVDNKVYKYKFWIKKELVEGLSGTIEETFGRNSPGRPLGGEVVWIKT